MQQLLKMGQLAPGETTDKKDQTRETCLQNSAGYHYGPQMGRQQANHKSFARYQMLTPTDQLKNGQRARDSSTQTQKSHDN